MSTWIIQKAPDARAGCKGACKQKITKGEVRWGKIVEIPEFGTTKQYFHMGCLKYPPRAGMDLEAVNGMDSLSKEEQEMAKAAFEKAKEDAMKPKGKKTKKEANVKEEKKKKEKKRARPEKEDESDVESVEVLPKKRGSKSKTTPKKAKKEKKKSRRDESDSESDVEFVDDASDSDVEFVDEDEPKKSSSAKKKSSPKKSTKRKKKGSDSEGETSKVISGDVMKGSDDPVVKKYWGMNISSLKDYLRLNLTIQAGKKEELIKRCVDGERNGRLLPCPICRKGRLQVTEQNDVQCSGYFDDSIQSRIKCLYKTSMEDAPRGKWLVPGEDENPDAAPADGKEGTGDDSKSSEVSEEKMTKVLAAFKKLPEDARPKDYAQLLVKVGREMGLKLPEDEMSANAKAGGILMSHKDEDNKFDVKAAFQQLRTECGTVEEVKKAQKAAAQDGPQSRVPENNNLANILEELGKLEFKAQDGPNFRFKAQARIKAAVAIRNCEFQVTSGKQVSKGKTKLPGIGEGSVALIDEIVQTGTSERLEELRGQYST